MLCQRSETGLSGMQVGEGLLELKLLLLHIVHFIPVFSFRLIHSLNSIKNEALKSLSNCQVKLSNEM